MTPAQRHRARMEAARATGKKVEPALSGGQPVASPEATPASTHRLRLSAAATALAAAQPPAENHSPAADPLPVAGATDPIVAQMALRLTHDLRRLKEIKSVAHKVSAKREMLPEYAAWMKGLIDADAGVGTGTAAEIAPTIMVWCIDVGDYEAALKIAEFLLRHNVPMPSRYNRDLASVITEEIATAALKAQATNTSFDITILEQVEALTGHIDMHDEIRAKLAKAIGIEMLDRAESAEASAALRSALQSSLDTLRRAQGLHDRIGVKDKIKRVEKLLSSNLAAFPPETAPKTDEPAKPLAS